MRINFIQDFIDFIRGKKSYHDVVLKKSLSADEHSNIMHVKSSIRKNKLKIANFDRQKNILHLIIGINVLTDTFLTFGKYCLDNVVYKAFEKDDIVNFIDNVIVNKNDFMKEKRENFAQSKVMLNYPNVAALIENHFNQIFGE